LHKKQLKKEKNNSKVATLMEFLMRITIPDLLKKKKKGEKITMLTAYDSLFTKIIDKNEIDMILVGDSLGMVVQGSENTLGVTLDEMIYHTKIVVRNSNYPFIVTDMPFMSYQASYDAVVNAGRIIKESGANAVKIEGGAEFADTIKALVKASIPVVGHIGLLPQSVNQFGKFKVQGRSEKNHDQILEDAKRLEEAGAFAIVLEAIPYELAKEITKSISIPTIGIGAGNATDGQVLVIYDLLGGDSSFNPKFLKKYLNLEELVSNAISEYKKDVTEASFPAMENTFFKTKSKEEMVSLYSS
jgi:3-methyl-2-oxobutanoate hydroxymethyltransferase